MIEHKGIAHLTSLVNFAITLATAVKRANEDGKINWLDALKFLPVLKEAPGALANIGEVPKELIDLDAPEADELLRNVDAHFGDLIPQGRTADIVDAALGCVPHLANLYQTIVNPAPKAQPVGDEALG